MTTTLLHVLLLSTAGAAPEGSLEGHAAVELQYSGTLNQVARNGNTTAAKQFDIYVLARAGSAGRSCFYFVSERGGGGWAWPERFGDLQLDDENARQEGRPIHLLQTHDGNKTPIQLPEPLFPFASRLAEGAKWTSGRLAYEVQRQTSVNKTNCWQIGAQDNFGRRQTFFVETGGSVVVAFQRDLFLGRGDRYRLRLDLKRSRPLTGAVLDQTLASIDTLTTLRAEMKRGEGETKPELTTAQIKAASAVVAPLTKQAASTPLKNLVVSISRDVQAQERRAGGIASLAKKFVGQKAPEYKLPTIRRKEVSSKSQANRVTVLHFWDYQGEPLEEPYGQVGYLDFLQGRRGRLGVDVIGVAVNEGFATKEKAGAALRSVRKLRDFMNLSYPIAVDTGDTLKSFGDPRDLGAKLPVWVVIGPDGKIAHYHVGFYAINPDEGLRELDAVVVRLARELRKSKEDAGS